MASLSTRLALGFCRSGLPGSWRVARHLKIGNEVATVRTRDGFRMRLDTSDFIQREIYVSGTWDEDVARAVRSHVKRGDLFVDAGANVGFFSLLAASLGARVVAFEPNPACHRAVVENAALNGFAIDARMVGLSDAPGTATLHIAKDSNVGAGTLRDVGGEGMTIKLDTLANQLSETPAVMKIDVEGSEIAAIKGAGNRLAPIVILEVSEYSLRKLAGGKDELFDLMVARGYTAEIISPVRRSNAVTDAIYFQYDAVFRLAK